MASGALQSIVIDGRRFTCLAEDETTVTLNGYTNEMITQGDGTSTVKKARHLGQIANCNVNCSDARDDQEFLRDVQAKMETVAITATMVDGTPLAGDMQITEMLERNLGNNTIPITLMGSLERG